MGSRQVIESKLFILPLKTNLLNDGITKISQICSSTGSRIVCHSHFVGMSKEEAQAGAVEDEEEKWAEVGVQGLKLEGGKLSSRETHSMLIRNIYPSKPSWAFKM